MTLISSPTRITGTLLRSADLSSTQRDEMFTLMDRHFIGVSRDRFLSDLTGKNWAMILQRNGATVGFSTMLVQETSIGGLPISVLYSGDTIVDPSAWHAAALPREWIAAVRQLRLLYPRGPLYWLLLTSGFRTYRLLSTFWESFYPRFDAIIPPAAQEILETLATEQYGTTYDRTTGIVKFSEPQVLRPHLTGIPPARMHDPHVEFFINRNPDHARGDELVSLCELTESNLARAGKRVVFGSAGPSHS